MIRVLNWEILHSGVRLHSSPCLLPTGQPQEIILLFQDEFMVWEVSFQTWKFDSLKFLLRLQIDICGSSVSICPFFFFCCQ